VAFVTLALPQRVYSLRRDNLILAMLTDRQGRGAPDVDLRSHRVYRARVTRSVGFRIRIVEAAGAHTHYAAARRAIAESW